MNKERKILIYSFLPLRINKSEILLNKERNKLDRPKKNKDNK